MNYTIKKTNIIKLFKYVKNQNSSVKKENINGNLPRQKN